MVAQDFAKEGVTMRLGLAVVAAMLVLLAVPLDAPAVWGGQTDLTHTGVGAFYLDLDRDGAVTADDLGCSGSYAGPSKDGRYDVFLTAGHCVAPLAHFGITAGDMYVSFDGDASDGVAPPLIRAQAVDVMDDPLHDSGDPHDLAVLLLPPGSAARLPAVQLPPAGYLDAVKAAGELKFMQADIVGYGVTPVWDEPGRTFYIFDAVRRSGTSTVIGLSKSMLYFNQNPNGNGTGSGVCVKDSGSPQFARGTLLLLSVTHGGNSQCNSKDANYRVDTVAARDFLGRYLTLP
jgi:hypothetical protein